MMRARALSRAATIAGAAGEACQVDGRAGGVVSALLNARLVRWFGQGTTMCQAIAPEPLLGRANATIRCLICGVMPVGGLLGGVLAGGWYRGRSSVYWDCSAASSAVTRPRSAAPARAWAEAGSGGRRQCQSETA